MVERKLVENIAIVCIVCTYVYYLCIQYGKPWPHSDIISCYCQSFHAFTSTYDCTLLGHVIFYTKGVLHKISLL